jgi:hypothetical protein
MALGSTQPLREMSTRKLPGGKKRPARRADNLAAIYESNVWNVGASTSRNPKGLHGLYRDNFTFTFIILLLVLYGCETWSLTIREEHRLRAFGNRKLRIFGLKRDEVTGGWRKLHKEDTCRRVQVMKLLIMLNCPVPYHVIPLGSRYSPQYPYCRSPSAYVLPLISETKFCTHTKLHVKL